MLQQTRVSVVEKYFNQWMRRFPTLKHLAQAKEIDVLRAWAGLGYYRRARNLRQAAMLVLVQFDGKVPKSESDLLQLPGIGKYTAGAIRSISFGIRTPAVDGNAARVLSRLMGIIGDPRRTDAADHIRMIAESLVSDSAPGEFNQALMDLGATVCRPRAPRCSECCISSFCKTFRDGVTHKNRPFHIKPGTSESEIACAIRSGNLWLLRRNSHKGPYAGLWEFPRIVQSPGERPQSLVKRFVRGELQTSIVSAYTGKPIVYYLMDRTIRLTPIVCQVDRSKVKIISDRMRWVSLKSAASVSISSPQLKVIRQLQQSTRAASRSASRSASRNESDIKESKLNDPV